jgi:hypothetical protein
MTDEQLRIIEKVKKMLTLSEGTNSKEEAETAVAMAQRMLSKYNLSIKDLDAYKEKAECSERGCRIRTKTLPQWVSSLMSLCMFIYDTQALVSSQKGERVTVYFIGVEPNNTICLNTFITLYKALDEMTLVEHPGLYVADRKTSWQKGFISGLYNKLREQKAATMAEERSLVLVQRNKINEYLQEQYANRLRSNKPRRNTSAKDSAAYMEGYYCGKDYNIAPQIEEAHGF